MWLFDLVVIRSGVIEVDALHSNTLALLIGGALSFTAGGLIAGLMPNSILRVHFMSPKRSNSNPFLRNLLLGILICALPILFSEVYQLSKIQGGGGLGILMQARQAQVEAAQNGEPVHAIVLDYFTVVATLASLLFATEARYTLLDRDRRCFCRLHSQYRTHQLAAADCRVKRHSTSSEPARVHSERTQDTSMAHRAFRRALRDPDLYEQEYRGNGRRRWRDRRLLRPELYRGASCRV